MTRLIALLVVLFASLLPAHAARAADDQYVIHAGDMLQVSVWKEEGLTADALVRPDGMLSFPLAGEIQAEGRSVDEVRRSITERLDKFVPRPMVTVTVKATAGNRFFVLGKVMRPGEFLLNGKLDVLQALSLAGGGTSFADLDNIRILRRDGSGQMVLRFRYGDVARGRNLAQNVLLRSGDTVVVP